VQFGVSLSFLEEFYSRNLGHLFISPIRTCEIIAALLCFSTLRAFIAIIPASLLAALFFQFNIFSMGFSLIIFVICLLMMGWWIGFIAMSIIVKYGVGTESLTWMFAYLLAPAAAVFYPVATLPHWLQIIAFIMPASHIFEGMRTIIIEHRFDSGQLLWAFGLNLIYLAVAILFLMQSLKGARNRGALLVVGE
jgi:ABC-2 type transport system permease protein